MKRAVRAALGVIAASSLLRPATRRVFSGHANVVYYHHVGRSAPHYSSFYAGCSVERFARDLERLAGVFRFDRLEAVCRGGEVPAPGDGRPALAVTFDDGFGIARPELLELFARHRIPVTTFVNTAFVDNRDLMWRNKLSAVLALRRAVIVDRYRTLSAKAGLEPLGGPDELLAATRSWDTGLKDELADELWRSCDMPPLAEYLAEHQPYLTSDELAAWLAAGHDIGLHTRSHPFCSRLDERGVDEEIVQPAAELRARYELGFLPLSYPFGDRLAADRERELVETGVVDAAFGIDGFAPHGTPLHRMERAGTEDAGVSWPVFARPLMRSVLRRRSAAA